MATIVKFVINILNKGTVIFGPAALDPYQAAIYRCCSDIELGRVHRNPPGQRGSRVSAPLFKSLINNLSTDNINIYKTIKIIIYVGKSTVSAWISRKHVLLCYRVHCSLQWQLVVVIHIWTATWK
jgi:hypothetical protein